MFTRNTRNDFLFFDHNPDTAYLDSAATSLKPRAVLAKTAEYYEQYGANVFRGIYAISEKATAEMEHVREIVANFISAADPSEVVFTRNTTESLNLLAYTLEKRVEEGDSVAVTAMEHHSNFVPWQQLAGRKGCSFAVVPVSDGGTIDPGTLASSITPRTKVFAFTHISNVLGSVNPAKELVAAAKKINPEIITVLDAAQSVAHIPIDVADIGCDFLAFSSHKAFGPTGAGVLWGKTEILESLPPFLFGGEMIESVSVAESRFKKPPYRFEAGTPAIGEIIGLGAALEYIRSVGFETIGASDRALVEYALGRLRETFSDRVTIWGGSDPQDHVSLISFSLADIHPHDIAQVLAESDVCVRAGSHCAMPLHSFLSIPGASSVRASFSLYNTTQDIDLMIEGIRKAEQIFRRKS